MAYDVHRSFKLYTGGNPNLNISGGLTAFRTKYPLYKMAEEVGELEEKAKRYSQDGEEKNALTLFRSDLVFRWNEVERIYSSVLGLSLIHI